MTKEAQKINRTHQGTIENLTHDGRGKLLNEEGKVTFIWGALPNETITYQRTHKFRHYNEGIATEIHKTSNDRITPECKHFGICGGCRLQHTRIEYQHTFKSQVAKEILSKMGDINNLTWEPILTDKSWGYRRKARLSIRYVEKKNKVLVGFRERNGRYVNNGETCAILAAPFNKLIAPLSEQLILLKNRDQIPQIEVTVGDDGPLMIIRHLKPLPPSDRTLLRDFATKHGITLYLQPGGLSSIALETPNNKIKHYYDLPEQNIRLFFTPEQFIQINAEINKKMITQALNWLNIDQNDRVLDCFCGLGNFSLPLATKAKHVIGIECNTAAIEQAKANATYNQLNNCTFVVEDLIAPPTNPIWTQCPTDILVLDPPRAGAKILCEQINIINPNKVLYISCHPASLARDLKTLRNSGYTIKKIGTIDMFAHTHHLEMMVLLEKSVF